MQMVEKWKAVSGYEGMYEVSNLGRVKSLARTVRCRSSGRRPIPEAFLTLVVMAVGYPAVTLRNGKTAIKRYVHDLVLRAFCGPPPDGHVARHYPDPTRTNCKLSNLRWGTPAHNSGDRTGNYLLDKDIEKMHRLRDKGASQPELAAKFGVSQGRVSILLSNKDRPIANPSDNTPIPRGIPWTSEMVAEIRNAKRGEPRELAKRYGVSLAYIYDIRYGRKLMHF